MESKDGAACSAGFLSGQIIRSEQIVLEHPLYPFLSVINKIGLTHLHSKNGSSRLFSHINLPHCRSKKDGPATPPATPATPTGSYAHLPQLQAVAKVRIYLATAWVALTVWAFAIDSRYTGGVAILPVFLYFLLT